MIKEWCGKCFGIGANSREVDKDNMPMHGFCEVCQGKGYTELEPNYVGNFSHIMSEAMFQRYGDTNAEFYIKESK